MLRNCKQPITTNKINKNKDSKFLVSKEDYVLHLKNKK